MENRLETTSTRIVWPLSMYVLNDSMTPIPMYGNQIFHKKKSMTIIFHQNEANENSTYAF